VPVTCRGQSPISEIWDAWDTIDCTINGGSAFSIGNTKLMVRINGEDLTGKPVMIFNLWSNFTHRYRQCDETLSLPYKANGKFHITGEVTVVSDETFKKRLRL
jgi:hypothetical protein